VIHSHPLRNAFICAKFSLSERENDEELQFSMLKRAFILEFKKKTVRSNAHFVSFFIVFTL
jgi:hypothetical protein